MPSRPYTKAKGKAVYKYEKNNYFKATIRFPKDAEDIIRKAANGNLNGYIADLVLRDCGYKKED